MAIRSCSEELCWVNKLLQRTRKNTGSGPHCMSPAINPSGTHTSRTLK